MKPASLPLFAAFFAAALVRCRSTPEYDHVLTNARVAQFDGDAISFVNLHLALRDGRIAELIPALAQAARTVGSPQIRAAGTLGGNLGTCSPAGDSLPVLSALNAVIHLIGPQGTRDVPWEEFMLGVKKNALGSGEFVHSITVPVIQGWQGYAKVGTRNAMVISTASACLVRDTEEGLISIALGSVGPTIIRCSQAEKWLRKNTSLRTGAQINADLAVEFGRRVSDEATPIDDHRSTAAYR